MGQETKVDKQKVALAGGSGGRSGRDEASDDKGIQDTRMLERAVRENWPIPEEARPAIVKRQIRIATKATSRRESTAAARCLVAMEGQNQKSQLAADGISDGVNIHTSQIILRVPDNGRQIQRDESSPTAEELL